MGGLFSRSGGGCSHGSEISQLIQQNNSMMQQLSAVQKGSWEQKQKYEKDLHKIAEEHRAQLEELKQFKDVNKIQEAEEKIFMNFLNHYNFFRL